MQKEIENIKSQLEEIDNERLRGLIIRSRIQWVEEGEKSSKYFFDLEKQNYIRKSIRKITTNSGENLTDPQKILEYQKQFYEDLLSSKRSKTRNYQSFIEKLKTPKLNLSDQLKCEGTTSLQECLDALNTMPKNKSPGIDGLTVEFYHFFFGIK